MSKFNFNIDTEETSQIHLDKSQFASNNQYNSFIQPIVDAFQHKNLDVLSPFYKTYLYDNFEEFRKYQFKVKTRLDLQEIIQNLDRLNRDRLDRPLNCTADLNWIDTSNITNMERMFSWTIFNGNISKWDVSHVKNMYKMFDQTIFNGDISEWDVSNVLEMSGMFKDSNFNGDISKWNVSNVKHMSEMFCNSAFNQDISNWDVSNVQDMDRMFFDSEFKGDISKWKFKDNVNKNFMFSNNKD